MSSLLRTKTGRVIRVTASGALLVAAISGCGMSLSSSGDSPDPVAATSSPTESAVPGASPEQPGGSARKTADTDGKPLYDSNGDPINRTKPGSGSGSGSGGTSTQPESDGRLVMISTNGSAVSGLAGLSGSQGERVIFQVRSTSNKELGIEISKPSGEIVASTGVSPKGAQEVHLTLDQRGTWTFTVQGQTEDFPATFIVA